MKIRIIGEIAIGAAIIAAGLAAIVLFGLAWPAGKPPKTTWGVSFSQNQAQGLGLEWKEAYQAILNDLGVKRLRLSAYWNIVEPNDDKFDFQDLDFQMDMARDQGAAVILGIGRKLPRWPECHEPGWVQNRSETEKQAEILEMLPVVIERYRDHPALRAWQLENEPFLDFGVCPPADENFLRREEALLRSLSTKPILVTDSGELSWWLSAARFGDKLGTTMYRTVFSARTKRLFHYDYIFPAWAYRLKAHYVKILTGKDVIVAELQGEPWGARPFPDMSVAERRASFSPERFRQLQQFANRTQLPEAYWWGVEYWYWEKEKQGNDQYWETAKEIFRR